MRGIDFAGVDVEHHRPILGQNLVGHLANQPVGKQPQIAAAEKAHGLAHQGSHGDGHLEYAFTIADAMRLAPSVAHTAMTARRGKYRRVVLIARLRQGIEKPWRLVGGREARSSISRHRHAGDVFQ